MIDAFIAVAITIMVLAVLVPLALAYLLLRQVSRSRTVRRVSALMGRPHRVPQRGSGSTTLPLQAPRLGRRWAQLAHDAHQARQRFSATVANLADGPLRQALADAMDEVDEAVGEASRLAWQGDRTERAHRDVVGALQTQRRRARRMSGATTGLEHSLSASTAAQQAAANRLAIAVERDLCQLQLVVARLHELTAHALELGTMASAPMQLTAASSIGDRVAALRIATAEVQSATAV